MFKQVTMSVLHISSLQINLCGKTSMKLVIRVILPAVSSTQFPPPPKKKLLPAVQSTVTCRRLEHNIKKV